MHRLLHSICLAPQGCVHITGGGFTENLPRVMPDGLACEVQSSSWQWPPLFQWLQEVRLDQLLFANSNVASCSIGLWDHATYAKNCCIDLQNMQYVLKDIHTLHLVGRCSVSLKVVSKM